MNDMQEKIHTEHIDDLMASSYSQELEDTASDILDALAMYEAYVKHSGHILCSPMFQLSINVKRLAEIAEYMNWGCSRSYTNSEDGEYDHIRVYIDGHETVVRACTRRA